MNRFSRLLILTGLTIFFGILAVYPVWATTSRNIEMTCGYCGKESSQRYLSSFSLPPYPIDLDLMPNMLIWVSSDTKECPHCGYLALEKFSDPALFAVQGVMESLAFKNLKKEPKIIRLFLQLSLLDEARQDYYSAGIDCLSAAWLLDPGENAFELEIDAREEAFSQISEKHERQREDLSQRKSQKEDEIFHTIRDRVERERREEELEAEYAQEKQELRRRQAQDWKECSYPLIKAGADAQQRAAKLRRQALELMKKAWPPSSAYIEDLDWKEIFIRAYLLAELHRRNGQYELAAEKLDFAQEILLNEKEEEREWLFVLLLEEQKRLINLKNSDRSLVDMESERKQKDLLEADK